MQGDPEFALVVHLSKLMPPLPAAALNINRYR